MQLADHGITSASFTLLFNHTNIKSQFWFIHNLSAASTFSQYWAAAMPTKIGKLWHMSVLWVIYLQVNMITFSEIAATSFAIG